MQLARRTTAGAPALLCFSTRFCLWESAWYLLHGEWRKAVRRWSGHSTAVLNGVGVSVHYPTVGEIAKAFAPHFVLRSATGVGIFVPPSYLEPWMRRSPRGLATLTAVDRVVCRLPVLRTLGDHVLLHFVRTAEECQLIILFHPRAVKPRSRRLPLAVLSLAAVLEGVEEYEIVDGNVDDHPLATIIDLIDEHDVELLGVSVMPGPQMVAGMEVSREVRRLRPNVRIAWGGYFPSIYPDRHAQRQIRRLRRHRPGRRYASRTYRRPPRPAALRLHPRARL